MESITKSMLLALALASVALLQSAAYAAGERHEVRQDKRELHHDRMEMKQERKEGDKAGVAAERREIRQDKAELRKDRRELREHQPQQQGMPREMPR